MTALPPIDRLASLVWFMVERHSIYLKRQAGQPWPWTADPILREYRFCNVYRELDTVTIWIREHVREPFADHPWLWFMLCIARRINWPATLEELMADKRGAWPIEANPFRRRGNAVSSAGSVMWRPERMIEVLDARTARGEQVYTGAYMITARVGPEHIGVTKSRATAVDNLLPLWQKAATIEPHLHGTLRAAFLALLRQGFAWGPFMTYEVVTDLRHTRYLHDAPDIYSWANAGPGAIRGLNRLYGRPLTDLPSPGQMCDEMAAILDMMNSRSATWAECAWPRKKGWERLELRDIEHSLCEFDKHQRVLLGEGRPRSKYQPPSPSKELT